MLSIPGGVFNNSLFLFYPGRLTTVFPNNPKAQRKIPIDQKNESEFQSILLTGVSDRIESNSYYKK